MKSIKNAKRKGKLRIAVLLLMIFMIIGSSQAWGAAPAWSQMGVSGINGISNANASSIVILNGTPYLAYTAYGGAGVLKYDGTNWTTVGTKFVSDQCNNVAMTASGSTLYVAYSNADYSRIEVKKINTATDTDWLDLGLANNSKALSQDSSLSLAVNSGSDIYLGYTDYSTSLFKVFHYDGSSWAWQFNVNGSTGCVTSVNGIAYSAYQDGSNYRLNQNSGGGWAQIQALNGPPLAMCHDDSGKIYILTKDVSSSNYLSVALYNTVSNTLSIVGSHIPVSSAYSPSISVDNGTVYVMYYISGGTSSLYAHESTADWVQVGPSLSLAYYGDMTAYNGTAYYAYSNQYNLAATKITYPVPVPKVTGVSPANGPEAGGTMVTITGENFTGVTGVSFGAAPAASFTVNSSTSITATAPVGSGTVDVTVAGPEGTSVTSSNDQFTYYQKPSVTDISPVSGPGTGGTSVSITGTNFTGATGVSFDVTPATSFTVNSSTSITAIAPAGSGTVDVTVTGPGGTSITSASDRYAYQTMYTVSIGTVSGGSITASPTTAAVGATINLTVTPTAGKQLKAGTLKYNDGTDHSITGNSFTMPAANVTVIAEFETITVPLTDSEMAAADKAALNIGYALGDNASSITQNLNFTTTGAFYSSGITWASSNMSVISNSGVVTRPAFSSGDSTVTVTATVNKNGAIDTKTFNLTVLKTSQTTNGGSGSGDSRLPEKPKTDMNVSGNTTTATTTAKATVDSSGKANAAVTSDQINDAVSKAVAEVKKQDNGTSAVVEVKVETAKDAKSVETKLPKTAFDAMASSSIAQLNVSTPVADITFDSNVLSAISDEASGDIKITASKVESSALSSETQQVVGDRPVFNFSVAIGDRTISQFGGNVSVSVPYSPKPGEDTNAIVIYYINTEGKPEIVSNCVYDPASGSITFHTNHFSQYAVGYNQVIFKDVASDAWYSKAVSFIAAREITTGTGSDMFSPKAKLTRGQFTVMLMKAYGISPDMSPKDNFTDAGNTYYTGYLAAAKRMGITAGVGNNMSAPEKEITRQEMFTLLYNALKAIDKLPQGSSGESLSSFNDAGNIASWAKDAMKLFAETGIISGSGNKLSPKDTTTRVQMAQVLYSLLSK